MCLSDSKSERCAFRFVLEREEDKPCSAFRRAGARLPLDSQNKNEQGDEDAMYPSHRGKYSVAATKHTAYPITYKQMPVRSNFYTFSFPPIRTGADPLSEPPGQACCYRVNTTCNRDCHHTSRPLMPRPSRRPRGRNRRNSTESGNPDPVRLPCPLAV